jgi:metal-sulfur cluster biosynthetic enzyme
MSAHDDALAALGTVRDPELDRPITELGFVAAVRVTGSAVRVELRLPTYFCAPNFAWLMVADARDALAARFDRAEVVLLEHFVSDEINAGVAAVSDFGAAFGGDEDRELAELRTTFERKAHLAAQERLARALLAAGLEPARLRTVDLTAAAELAPDAAAAVARRRARLGLESRYALCDEGGGALSEDRLPGWLRFARTVRVSIDGNASFCRGLLQTRYGLARTA